MSVQDNSAHGAAPWHSLPQEMRDRPQWLLAAPNAKGERKVPTTINHETGELAPGSSTDPSTWLTFPFAAAHAAERGLGLGYVLAADDPYTCIDLDIKPDTPAEHLERMQVISRAFDSYTEASISGLGAHVWVRGNIGPGRKRDGVEVYSQERFIVCTGRVVHAAPIEDRQAMLDNMVTQMPQPDDDGPLPDVAERLADAQVWAAVREHMGDELFDAVCRGDYVAAGKPSGSELDAKLLEALMFVGASDEQCRRMYVTTELAQRTRAGASEPHMLKDDRLLNKALRYARRQWSARQAEQAAAQAHGAQVAAGLQQPRQGAQAAPGGPQAAGPAPGQPAAPATPQAHGLALLQKHRVNLKATPQAVHFLWGRYVLEGECALLGGHGGKGKSMLALQLACHLAAGKPFLGKPVSRACRVLFYSAEDPGARVLRRVTAICAQAGLDADAVHANLCVIDATELDPLFAEVQEVINMAEPDAKRPFYVTRRSHKGTDAFVDLRCMVEAFDAEALVIDGASDTFDGDEVKRAQVRAFMRMLVRAHPARRMTVLLLAHVNRIAAGSRRAQNDDEGYSGSTAWHNSARSRIYLDVLDSGQPVLKHKKNQEGTLEADVYLERLDASGLFVTPTRFAGNLAQGAAAQAKAAEADRMPLLLKMLHHYTCLAQAPSTKGNSGGSAYNTFKSHPLFPAEWKDDTKAGRAAVQELMELSASQGKVESEPYVDSYRNTRTRWRLTELGAAGLDEGLR